MRALMSVQLFSACVLILLSGCGANKNLSGDRDENSSDAVAGQFLAPGTFTADDKQTTLTALEAQRTINAMKIFYNEAPAATSSTNGASSNPDYKCWVKGDQATSTEHSMTLFLDMDSSGCPKGGDSTQTSSTDPVASNSTIHLRLFLTVTCSDSIAPNLQGKSAYDVIYGDSKDWNFNCEKDASTSVLTNFETHVEVTTANASSTSRSFTATMAEDGTPCTRQFDGTTFIINGCGEFGKKTSNSSFNSSTGSTTSSSKSTMNKVVHRDIRGQVGTRYFSSGKFDLLVNNWTGSMTYSDGATSPTYSITDSKTTSTGSYTGPAVSGLVQPTSSIEEKAKTFPNWFSIRKAARDELRNVTTSL